MHRHRSICRGEVTLGAAVARVSVWVDILRRLGLLVVEYRGPHDQEFSFARCRCWDHQFLEWISLRGRSRAGWELARQRLARWAEWRGSDDCSKADSRKSMPTELLKCQMLDCFAQGHSTYWVHLQFPSCYRLFQGTETASLEVSSAHRVAALVLLIGRFL